MFLLDLSHTSHTRARTGIQRVVRSLQAALGERALAITHDPHIGAWRELAAWERGNLAAESPASQRGAQWPVAAKIRGRTRRILGRGAAPLPTNEGLIVPEVFSAGVAAAFPALFAATRGPRVALFHDAIALQYPELTPAKTVARFPAYLAELLCFDGIAAVSEDSRDSLLEYWKWLGVRRPPPVHAIPLGIEPQQFRQKSGNSPNAVVPTALCIGSIEGRKNHVALLEACHQLWARGERFSLHLIGLSHPQTGAAALARIRELQAAGCPLRYDGPVSDAGINTAYAGCTFTVYPSLKEGFGLPVIESLSHGKPCICSAHGALGESARGGGCVMLDRLDAPAIADAMHRLLSAPSERSVLASQAQARRFKTWADYATELTEWISTLSRHNTEPSAAIRDYFQPLHLQ